MKLLKFHEYLKESLPNQHSVDQFNRIRKLSRSTDIGDRVGNMETQGANILFDRNPIDTGIISYEDYMKSNTTEKSKKSKKKNKKKVAK